MFARNYDISLAVIGLCSFSILSINARADCDLGRCRGPLNYYRELGCAPISENASSCCPTRYNCDQWTNLPDDRCLVNGQVYERGELLPMQNINNLCLTCTCAGRDGSKFACRVSTCPDIPEENFLVEFLKPGECGNAFFATKNCAPIYPVARSLVTDCNSGFRCYNADTDFVMDDQTEDQEQSSSITLKSENFGNSCKFGNLTLRIGQSINSLRENLLYRTVCVCEVPPVLTCRHKWGSA